MAEYDLERFESFTLSRSCISFDVFLKQYEAQNKKYYFDVKVTAINQYMIKILDVLMICDNYTCDLWMTMKRFAQSRENIDVIKVTAIIEYIAEVVSDFAVTCTASEELFLKFERSKVMTFNKKIKLQREFRRDVKRKWAQGNVQTYHTNMIKVSHQLLMQSLSVYFDVHIDPITVN